MSNELFTPVLLSVSSTQDQRQAVMALLEKQGLTGILDQTWVNEEAETISIEMVRDIITNLSYATTENARLVALLHAEQLSLPAQQALLKTLEEPPAHTLLVLATQRPQSLLPTIQSRCVLVNSEVEDSESEDVVIPELLKKLLEKPDSVSFAQCIELAEMYKDRGEAAALMSQCLRSFSTTTNRNAIQAFVECLDQLQKNVNVSLAVEQCFFHIKQQ